jgi:hypothetical protein
MFSEESDADHALSDTERELANVIGDAIKAYLRAGRALAVAQYADLAPFAPAHFREDSAPLALVCSDGLIVRYDAAPNPKSIIRIAFMAGSLTDWAPRLSEGLIHCPYDSTSYDPGGAGPTIHLSKFDKTSDERSEIARMQVTLIAPLQRSAVSPAQVVPARPRPLVSVQNEFDLLLQGEILGPSGDGTRRGFVARSRMRLPTGWQVFEVYHPLDPAQWRPELAASWAEADLLAAAARHHLQESGFRAIDPNAAARRRLASVLRQFEELLEGPEEPVHQFLKQHPELLSPTHLRSWSKLPLGKRATDFVFREPRNEYLLVELESPRCELFRHDGQIREELVHAQDQVLDWQRYIEDNLATVQRELALEGLSSAPRYLIVIGRSRYLTDENRRKLTTLQNVVPKLKIISYDEVASNAKMVVENLLGPLWDVGGNVEIYYLPRGAAVGAP